MSLDKPACLVIGAGGFIGTNLCRHLTHLGWPVHGYGRGRRFPAALQDIPWTEGTLENQAALASALVGREVVFHLVHATMPREADQDVVADVERNVVATLRLLDLCREQGVKRVVYVSSGGTIYGKARVIPTPESAPTDPICAYGISKLSIEKYLGLFQHLHGLDYRVLRVANPFGPFQGTAKSQGVIAALIERGLTGEPMEIWGDGSVVRDFIPIDDVSTALAAAALDRSDERVFNIGEGVGRDLRSVIAAIGQALGRDLAITWKPARALDVPVSVVDIARARAVLGWRPMVPFAEGIRRAIDWRVSLGRR